MRRTPPAIARSPRRFERLSIAAGLVALALTAYGRLATCDFVSIDDPKYVTENPHVRTGLTRANLVWALSSTHASNWHPVTWISHMADCQLFGLNPAAHHMGNVVLHAANTVLLFLFLILATGSTWRSAFVAALFAVHPLHVESVAWVAERKDVLSTFFGFIALATYVRYTRHPRMLSYLAVTLFFVLSLLAKPMWVTFPFLLLLVDVWPLARLETPGTGASQTGVPLRTLLLEKLPWLGLSLASCAVTYLAQKVGGAMEESAALSLQARLGNALVAYVRYLGKMLWPRDLAVFYPHEGIALPVWQVVGSAVLLAALTAVFLSGARRRPYLAVGWLWYLGTLVPVIGLVQVGTQSIADRYTYLPLVGPFMMIAWGAPELVRLRKAVLVPVATGIVVAFAAGTFVQAGYWKNTRTLFVHAIEVSGNQAGFRSSLGLALQREGKIDEAIAEYREALRLDPSHVPALINLAAALAGRGQVDEAMPLYERVLALRPDDADAHNNLGAAYRSRGRLDRAEAEFKDAIRARPDYALAEFNLGTTLVGQGRNEEALTHFSRAIELEPDNAGYRNNMGATLAGLGRLEEAVEQYRRALALDSSSVKAHNNLGVALTRQGKLDEAIAQYREAIRLQPDYANAHANLAKVLLGKGDYAGASEEVRLARRFGGNPDPQLLEELARAGGGR